MAETVRAIFVTGKLGAKQIFDKQGFIGKFTDSKDNIMDSNEGLVKNDKMENKWFMILTDQDKINRVRALASFNKQIFETKAEPIIGQVNNLKRMADPNVMNNQALQALEIKVQNLENKAKEEKAQMLKDTRRYGLLSAQLVKPDGDFYRDADPELINEFKQLQAKLGIEEAKEAEVTA